MPRTVGRLAVWAAISLLALAAVWAIEGGSAEAQSGRSETLSAGSGFTCAVSETGAVQCWGQNSHGQASPPSGSFSQVSAGETHACALTSSGQIRCWGNNSNGQASPPSGTFSQVSVGPTWACALTSGGEVHCWGNNDNGQASPPSGTFSQVSTDAVSLHTCALTDTGALRCWGHTGEGRTNPPAGSFSQVATGGGHACALTTASAVQCWGLNHVGQANPPSGSFSEVSAGWLHSCALTTSGAVQCWGRNDEGQASPPSGSFSKISAGTTHSCALTTSGAVQCWGQNNHSQSSPPSGLRVMQGGGSQPQQYQLTAQASPSSWGSVSGGGSYDAGSRVVLSATPVPGYMFYKWEGDARGYNSSTVLALSGDAFVTALFIPEPVIAAWQGMIPWEEGQPIQDENVHYFGRSDRGRPSTHIVGWKRDRSGTLLFDTFYPNYSLGLTCTAGRLFISASTFRVADPNIDASVQVSYDTGTGTTSDTWRVYGNVHSTHGDISEITGQSIQPPWPRNAPSSDPAFARQTELVQTIIASSTFRLTVQPNDNPVTWDYSYSLTQMRNAPVWNNLLYCKEQWEASTIRSAAVPLAFISDPSEGGAISVDGASVERASYEVGEEISLEAEPLRGYEFVEWRIRETIGGQEMFRQPTDNPLQFTVGGPGSVTAVFLSCPVVDLGSLNEESDYYLNPLHSKGVCRSELPKMPVQEGAHIYTFNLPRLAYVGIHLNSDTRQPEDADLLLKLYNASGTLLEENGARKDANATVSGSTVNRNVQIYLLLDTGTYHVVATTSDGDPGDYTVEIGRCDPSQIPNKLPDTTGLVLIAHGWTSNASKWADGMASAMRFQIQLGGWQAHAYDWQSDAKALPHVARTYAVQHGRCLAKAIDAREYEQLHMIGHSAGAILVDEIADTIKRLDPNTVTQVTLLDAFSGGPRGMWDGSLGDHADFTEHYVNTDDKLTWSEVHSKENLHTIDLTKLRNELDEVDDVDWNGGHAWPRGYYLCSIFAASGNWDASLGADDCGSGEDDNLTPDLRKWMEDNKDNPDNFFGWSRSIAITPQSPVSYKPGEISVPRIKPETSDSSSVDSSDDAPAIPWLPGFPPFDFGFFP